ncbi:hypothetical protein BDU57DRAFT_540699 [Ampelomyces quisqualis]|uniref:Uncharacterized protein n=1 Tax=Ampelomyces quisqualis TaxID=50730 RepID=A0A6A5QH28_AMPQU|nr:hypothetical protein BDU57DRAFT_540699 [Ampelomyces quisqualis]
MSRTTIPFDFFGLGRELRNQIYHETWLSTPNLELYRRSDSEPRIRANYTVTNAYEAVRETHSRGLPAWLLTNKAMMAEGLEQFCCHGTVSLWTMEGRNKLLNIFDAADRLDAQEAELTFELAPSTTYFERTVLSRLLSPTLARRVLLWLREGRFSGPVATQFFSVGEAERNLCAALLRTARSSPDLDLKVMLPAFLYHKDIECVADLSGLVGAIAGVVGRLVRLEMRLSLHFVTTGESRLDYAPVLAELERFEEVVLKGMRRESIKIEEVYPDYSFVWHRQDFSVVWVRQAGKEDLRSG